MPAWPGTAGCKQDAPVMRLCLGGCGRMFSSDGPHHRLCRACNTRNASASYRDRLVLRTHGGPAYELAAD